MKVCLHYQAEQELSDWDNQPQSVPRHCEAEEVRVV